MLVLRIQWQQPAIWCLSVVNLFLDVPVWLLTRGSLRGRGQRIGISDICTTVRFCVARPFPSWWCGAEVRCLRRIHVWADRIRATCTALTAYGTLWLVR